MTTSELLYIKTSDDLRLNGVHYAPKDGVKDTCVLFVHGMSGNILENYFAHVLGQILSLNDIGFLYGHNRGYNHINDIVTSKLQPNGGYESKRLGATYERFKECLIDIEAWLQKVSKLGYKNIILAGHSLGCNKVIYYFHSKKPDFIKAVILLSPPDMVGLFESEKYQKNHNELLAEAKKNVEAVNPRKLVSGILWDWYNLSSQTYIDLSETEGAVDNLPLLRNPERFVQLESLNCPVLCVMGEYDDIVIRSLEEDQNLISSKAVNVTSFTKKVINKASHTYDSVEEDLAKEVLDWIKRL